MVGKKVFKRYNLNVFSPIDFVQQVKVVFHNKPPKIKIVLRLNFMFCSYAKAKWSIFINILKIEQLIRQIIDLQRCLTLQLVELKIQPRKFNRSSINKVN